VVGVGGHSPFSFGGHPASGPGLKALASQDSGGWLRLLDAEQIARYASAEHQLEARISSGAVTLAPVVRQRHTRVNDGPGIEAGPEGNGKDARLSYCGHVLMENRNGLVVDSESHRRRGLLSATRRSRCCGGSGGAGLPQRPSLVARATALVTSHAEFLSWAYAPPGNP
jgi:hypothetical protein